MVYEMINKELQIASCSIADLTMEQTDCFLKQWEPGSSIGTLTLFFDKSGRVVLNRDNKRFDYYKDFTEAYLSNPEKARKRITDKMHRMLEAEIKVLDHCINFRTVGREVDRAIHGYIPEDNHRKVLHEIQRRYNDTVFASNIAFLYGVMEGKRVERAKRRKVVQ